MQSPFFLLLGDSFLCEEKRKEIVTHLEKEFGPDLPVTVRSADEVSLDSLFREAGTLPFLAPAQVFCLRRSEKFSKSDLALWETYFKSPHPQSFFIFEAESLEKNHPFLKGAEHSKQLFILRPQAARLVADFIRKKLKATNKKISAEALEVLESRLGDSFLFLDTVLDQLILASGEKPEIDRATVEALEEKLVEFEGGDLIQALAEKNAGRALEILNDLLEVSVRDAPALIGLLHWQLRRFWEAKKAVAAGLSEREAASQLRIWPSQAGIFFKQLGRFSVEELERILDGLFDLDWRLKTGRAEGRYEVENWLISAIG